MESICYEDNIGGRFEYTYNQMNYVIVGTLVYGLGLTIASWIISRCIIDKEDIQDIIEEEEEKKEIYEEKYPLENIKICPEINR